MAKRRGSEEKGLQSAWAALPQSDKWFVVALMVITEVIGDERLGYHELPTRLERTLHEADRDTRFSVIVECLYLLLEAPGLERVKRAHRRRGDGRPVHTHKQGSQGGRSAGKRGKGPRSRSK